MHVAVANPGICEWGDGLTKCQFDCCECRIAAAAATIDMHRTQNGKEGGEGAPSKEIKCTCNYM